MTSAQPVCEDCHQPIVGTYISALGSNWHLGHFRCTGCTELIEEPSYAAFKGAPYHTGCYLLLVAPRCGYCGKPLEGSYMVDHWGVKFCQEHNGQYPICCFCGRLIPPQHRSAGARIGGRVRCPICRTSAIDSIEQAKPIFAGLVRWLNGEGLTFNNLDLHIELRNDTQMAHLIGDAGNQHTLGVTLHSTRTRNGKVVKMQVDGVSILRSLPAVLFQGVTIHELGHAWLAVHAISGLEAWQEEGFCELLSHRFYSQLNTADTRYHAACIEKNSSPIYGEGFRRVRSIANSLGFARLLNRLLTERQLPNLSAPRFDS